MKLNNILQNKKADISINILVILVLAMTAYSLFAFTTTSNKVKTTISGVQDVNRVYAQREVAESQLTDILQDSIIKTYFQIADSLEYIGNPPGRNDNGPEFIMLNPDIEENVRENTFSNIRDYFISTYNSFPEQEFLTATRTAILDNANFKPSNVIVTNDEVGIKLYKIDLGMSFGDSSMDYLATLSPLVQINQTGIHSFQEIYLAKEECKNEKSANEIENCIAYKLPNFGVTVKEKAEGDKKYFVVQLESFRVYLFHNIFQKFSMQFILK